MNEILTIGACLVVIWILYETVMWVVEGFGGNFMRFIVGLAGTIFAAPVAYYVCKFIINAF